MTEDPDHNEKLRDRFGVENPNSVGSRLRANLDAVRPEQPIENEVAARGRGRQLLKKWSKLSRLLYLHKRF